jgi:hypothetical protein
VTLALHTLPRGQGAAGAPRVLLPKALHSRFAQAVAHPLFTVPLFIGSLYGLYFTPEIRRNSLRRREQPAKRQPSNVLSPAGAIDAWTELAYGGRVGPLMNGG